MNKRNAEGQQHGYWQEYYESGNLYSKGEYVNGEYHGPWEFYYRDETIDAKVEFDNGKYHGLCESYFGNGKICYTGLHINDEEVGFWKHFDINGNLIEKAFHL
jgi:uncharacterized protein